MAAVSKKGLRPNDDAKRIARRSGAISWGTRSRRTDGAELQSRDAALLTGGTTRERIAYGCPWVGCLFMLTTLASPT
jgi:hypothetical protein